MVTPNNPKLELFNSGKAHLSAPPSALATASGQAHLSAHPSALATAVRLNAAAVVSSPALTVDGVEFQDPAVEASPLTKVKRAKRQTHSHSADILTLTIKGEYEYAMLGLILGALTIVGGTILGLYGVAGHTSWSAKLFGFESNMGDAAPGVVLFVVGIFFILITRPQVDLKDLKG